MFEKIKKTKAYPVALLTVVVLVSVALLMGLNTVTEPVIEAQRKSQIIEMLEDIFPLMTDFKQEDEIYYILQDGQEIGYAFIARGSGYGGEISIMVGLDSDLLINGVSIVSHIETPGLGSRIEEEEFTNQFKGLGAGDLALEIEGGQIDAITGATVSSQAVVLAIREEIEEKLKAVK
ncbi:MAG: RnfABCDGE type electron transport complex subunit G [Actinomycetota bacterium]